MESMNLDNISIQKQYQQYLIKLSSDLDIINVLIEKDNRIYESTFNLEYLHKQKLLMSIKLILISTLPNHPNVVLNLQKKNIISNEMIERLFKEFENIKKENKELKESVGKLNKRIEKLENNNQILKKENKELKDSIDILNKRIEKLEKNNKIKEIENRIEKLEGFHYIDNKHKIQLKSCNLKNINSIHSHKDWITSVSTFPSGNIISTSYDKSIIIYDIHFNILQNIPNAHDSYIYYVEIKDEY